MQESLLQSSVAQENAKQVGATLRQYNIDVDVIVVGDTIWFSVGETATKLVAVGSYGHGQC